MPERVDIGGGFQAPIPSNYLLGFEVQGDSVVHNSNYPRPATQEEKVLWAEYQRARMDHTGACRTVWEMYQAGTGKTIDTFKGVATQVGPVEEVREVRNHLIHVIERTRRQLLEMQYDPIDPEELLNLLDVNNVGE